MDSETTARQHGATSVGAWLAQCGRERVQERDRQVAKWERKRKAAEEAARGREAVKVASFHVRATMAQSVAWKVASEREGFASVGAWAGEALDAYLRARARAGRPLPLSWYRGRFSVLLMDGRTVEARGAVSPPFAHFQGSSHGPGPNQPRTLVCLATGRVIATLLSARPCREFAAELAPVWLRDRELAAGS